jgi:hypothetical protein
MKIGLSPVVFLLVTAIGSPTTLLACLTNDARFAARVAPRRSSRRPL